MKTINQFLCLIIIVILLSFEIFAQTNSSEEVFNSIKNQYSGINSISFKFESVENPPFSGEFKAKINNSYKISTPIRIISCDGKTITNFDVNEKKAIICNFDASANSSLAFENLFFGALDNLKPVAFVKENSSKNKITYILKLVPKENNSSLNVKEISILTDKDGKNIYGILIDNGTNKFSWKISNIKINPVFSDETFNYTPPAGTDVIDLR